jgi:hypothetical protein
MIHVNSDWRLLMPLNRIGIKIEQIQFIFVAKRLIYALRKLEISPKACFSHQKDPSMNIGFIKFIE